MAKTTKGINISNELVNKIKNIVDDIANDKNEKFDGVEELTFFFGDEKIAGIKSHFASEHNDEGSGMEKYFHLLILDCDPEHRLEFEISDNIKCIKPEKNMIVSFNSLKSHSLTSNFNEDIEDFYDIEIPLIALSIDTSKNLKSEDIKKMYQQIIDTMEKEIYTLTGENIYSTTPQYS